MVVVVTLLIIVGLAVFLLRGFDRIAGRGPKQVRDGMKPAKRQPCPHCAEPILPAATVCPHCRSDLSA